LVEVIVTLLALAANLAVIGGFVVTAYLAVGNIGDNPQFAAMSALAAFALFLLMQLLAVGEWARSIIGWTIGGIVHGFGYVLIIAIVGGIFFFLTKMSEEKRSSETE
jgi:hypothetical protein